MKTAVVVGAIVVTISAIIVLMIMKNTLDQSKTLEKKTKNKGKK